MTVRSLPNRPITREGVPTAEFAQLWDQLKTQTRLVVITADTPIYVPIGSTCAVVALSVVSGQTQLTVNGLAIGVTVTQSQAIEPIAVTNNDLVGLSAPGAAWLQFN